MATPAKIDSERKTDRMELRMTPSKKAVIQRATAITGLTAGDLAYERAREVVERHDTMVLTGANAEAFLKALLDPPPLTPRLHAALERHRELFG